MVAQVPTRSTLPVDDKYARRHTSAEPTSSSISQLLVLHHPLLPRDIVVTTGSLTFNFLHALQQSASLLFSTLYPCLYICTHTDMLTRETWLVPDICYLLSHAS